MINPLYYTGNSDGFVPVGRPEKEFMNIYCRDNSDAKQCNLEPQIGVEVEYGMYTNWLRLRERSTKQKKIATKKDAKLAGEQKEKTRIDRWPSAAGMVCDEMTQAWVP